MLTEDYITEIFCCTDDLMKKIEENLRKRGPQPKLSDAEVITMEIVGESPGMDCDKAIHRYFRDHWRHLFPGLGVRTTSLRQAANLWCVKQQIREDLLKLLLPFGSQLSITDGFPMPVCGFRRAYFSSVFKECAAYGYCAAKNFHYYGLKGYLLIDQSGVVLDFGVAPANIDEREMLLETRNGIAKDVLGDKGFIGNETLKEEFKAVDILPHTPLRSNRKDDRPAAVVEHLNNRRRLIETVIGQLAERFKIEKVRARDLWHLTVRVGRKLLAHTINCLLNHKLGNPILQFERIFN
jgi:hypothetical protein